MACSKKTDISKVFPILVSSQLATGILRVEVGSTQSPMWCAKVLVGLLVYNVEWDVIIHKTATRQRVVPHVQQVNIPQLNGLPVKIVPLGFLNLDDHAKRVILVGTKIKKVN